MPSKKSTVVSSTTSKPLKSKLKKVTEKLGAVNEEMMEITEETNALEESQKDEKDLQTLCESFIKGQGSIYVLEDSNKLQTDEGIQDNGPKYIKRAWNPRTIGKTAIAKFIDSNGGPQRIFPKFQEYAITIAVSSSLLNDNSLAQYKSHEFPCINFEHNDNGNIYIVNGHHRIEAWKHVNQNSLVQLHNYENLLKGQFSVTSHSDTPEIIEARSRVEGLKKSLFKEGGWGAVVLDYDAIVAHSRAEDIKAFWGRNLAHFHIPDSAQDMLQIILRAVRSMSPQRGFDFLESQISRADKADQNKLRPLIKNPCLLFIFSELMTLPMFEQIKLVNFHKLDKWHNMVPCWLDIFLSFARDSYRFIAFPAEEKFKSITDVEDCDASTTEYAFGLLDTSFHDIIDGAYKNHLAPVFLTFGAPDGVVQIKGEERGNWRASFVSYRLEVLEKLNEWQKGKDRPKQYRAHYSILVDRITYILDKACQEYQFISKLGVPIPLACNTFIQDLGQDIYQFEVPMFEFLTLLEPTIAMRYGYKKKFTTPFDIFELFHNLSAMPTGRSTGNDWIMGEPTLDGTIAEIWAALFLARHTVISTMRTMHSRKQSSWVPVKASDVRQDSQSMDAHFALGLAEVMNIWVKEQRAIEIELTDLTDEERAFLDGKTVNPKRYGCVFPPSSTAMPNILDKGFKFTKTDQLTDEHKAEMQQCLQILLSSYHPWSAQYSSTPNQHHIGIAISTMQLNRGKGLYKHYLGEDIVWDLFAKILGLLKEIQPSYKPWHGVASPEDRLKNTTQVILQQSLCDEIIGPLLGATMAQSTAAINERYRIGLQQMGKVVQEMAVYVHEDKRYISYDVNLKLRELYQTLAKECVHQAFQYEQDQNYLPPEQIDTPELDRILKDRLDFSFPLPNLQVMTNMQRSEWYGSDGMSKAYNFSSKGSFGNREIERQQRKQELKAQKIIDDKANKCASTSKINTAAEDEAIEHFDPSAVAQKRARVVSSEGVSPRKRSKHHTTSENMGDEEVPMGKGKGKEKPKILVQDSDSGVDGDGDFDDDVHNTGSDSPPAHFT